jgi:hypothetical protein
VVIDQVNVCDAIFLKTENERQLPDTETLQKPLKFPVSGCSRKPGKSISRGIRAIFK